MCCDMCVCCDVCVCVCVCERERERERERKQCLGSNSSTFYIISLISPHSY